jgi:DNA polymerase III delta prime subunit
MNTLDVLISKPGSYLLYGSASEAVQNLLKTAINYSVNNPDVLVIDREDKKSIGIAQIKASLLFLTKKPLVGNLKTIAVMAADKMTDEAQNAFLKTLEEPPSYAKIVLLSANLGDILETVLSRCIKIDLRQTLNAGNIPANDTSTEFELTMDSILSANLAQRLKLAEQLSKEEKPDIVDQLKHFIAQERAKLQNGSAAAAANIKLMQNVIGDLDNTNVGSRFALENLFIHLI